MIPFKIIKKALFILILYGFIGNIQAQELNNSAHKLKDVEPELYAGIEAYSKFKWNDNTELVVHSINEQTDAYLRLKKIKEQPDYVEEYFLQALKDYPAPKDFTDWIGLESFYKIILEHNKDVVQPMVTFSLKGFTIGEKLEGDSTKFTSVGGTQGDLKAHTLNDETIYMLFFVSGDENGKGGRLSDFEINTCISAIEKYYNFEFIESRIEFEGGNRLFTAKKGDIDFKITLFKDGQDKAVFTFRATSSSLNSINSKEKRERVNSDF